MWWKRLFKAGFQLSTFGFQPNRRSFQPNPHSFQLNTRSFQPSIKSFQRKALDIVEGFYFCTTKLMDSTTKHWIVRLTSEIVRPKTHIVRPNTEIVRLNLPIHNKTTPRRAKWPHFSFQFLVHFLRSCIGVVDSPQPENRECQKSDNDDHEEDVNDLDD